MNNIFKVEPITKRDLTGGKNLPLKSPSSYQVTIPYYYRRIGFRALPLIDRMCMCLQCICSGADWDGLQDI